jgi:hypothetical protein
MSHIQQHPASYDGTIGHLPRAQDSNGWQWYSTAQVPSSSHPSYTTVSNSHQTHATDYYPLHWARQESGHVFLEDRRDGGAFPTLSPPAHGHFPSQAPQQTCTTVARDIYPGSYASYSIALPRASTFPRGKEHAIEMYDVNNERAVGLHQTPYPDQRSTIHSRRHSHASDERTVDWCRDSRRR